MIPNVLKDRVQIQEKVSVLGAMGQSITWKPIKTLWGRRITLSVAAVAQYQQIGTEVTDKYIFRGTEEINLGEHRILHGSKIYEPKSSAKHYDGVTEVVVLEV